MREIKANLLPVISEEWGQEKEGEEVQYIYFRLREKGCLNSNKKVI